MPRVGSKKYPYTASGMAAAKAAKKKRVRKKAPGGISEAASRSILARDMLADAASLKSRPMGPVVSAAGKVAVGRKKKTAGRKR